MPQSVELEASDIDLISITLYKFKLAIRKWCFVMKFRNVLTFLAAVRRGPLSDTDEGILGSVDACHPGTHAGVSDTDKL